MYLDLWTSPVVGVLGSKYYLVILDDFTYYLWTFLLKLKSETFTTLSNFFAYVHSFILSSTAPSRPSSVTTGVSLTTLPPRHFSCRKAHNFERRVHTHLLKMVKLNVSFLLLKMSSARCLFRRPFLGANGLKGFTLPHIN
jgi:hypothetical protein